MFVMGGADIAGYKFYRKWKRFPFPLLVFVAFLLVGFFLNKWHPAWMLMFCIPLYYLLGRLIAFRKPVSFAAGAYPIVCISWFCWMAFVQNDAHPAWISLLTIPVVEGLLAWYAAVRKAKVVRDAIDDMQAAAATYDADAFGGSPTRGFGGEPFSSADGSFRVTTVETGPGYTKVRSYSSGADDDSFDRRACERFAADRQGESDIIELEPLSVESVDPSDGGKGSTRR